MSLKILIKGATNLRNLESVGKSDPYVNVTFQGSKLKTDVKSSTLDPVWDKDLSWELTSKPPRADETIYIEVKDYERIGWNKLLGKTEIPLRNILHGGAGTLEMEQTLLDNNNDPTSGILKLSITYTPPKGGTAPSKLKGLKPSTTSTTKSGEGTAGATVTEVDEAGVEYSGGMPVMSSQSSRRSRDNLSNVKTKFQVRVCVVEARQLMGSDINPVCRVSFIGETKQTRVHRSTISPWFDELFFFHVELLPCELLENFLEFKVCNSSLLRAGTTIGSFKCEVGQVYDQSEHTLHNRWLVLAHPDEPTPTVQGYLKVSISVLGPGDVCPELVSSRSTEDDVEENLLWSAGVHLQPAAFRLSIYCAQNLPRMDAGTMQSLKEIFKVGTPSKELVDPYLIVSYAGREVQTKVLYCNDNPEFRQHIYLGFLFPSMCNTLKISLMDWDRVGHDDVIGTAVIPITDVSAPGDDGFLPTFGPSFVNVYGSRREWELLSKDENDQMNVGTEEGCSYRGRVMVSLSTTVGSYPQQPVVNMDDEGYNRVRMHRATRGFVLMAQMTHVSLLKDAGKPLELEVSIGNFGNKLENSLMPSPSSTHPTNPVFDGCKYYFLPWENTSPLIAVQCQWEDVSHRMFSSNAINYIAKNLQMDLNNIKAKLRSRRPNQQELTIQDMIKKMITRLTDGCSAALPEPDPIRHVPTALDGLLMKRRKKELKNLVKLIVKLSNVEADKVIAEMEGALVKLQKLAMEPQSSLPDVFIWLMSGTERKAYIRIPAKDILHSYENKWCGGLSGCFTSHTLKFPGETNDEKIGGLLRASLWLGREEEVHAWWDARTDLQLTIYAEAYENQLSIPGSDKWKSKGTGMTRPHFSDADGLKETPLEKFRPTDGWKFQGDWIVDPDPSVKFSADANHNIFMEEVFQQQARVPGGTWIDAPTTWSDIRGDPASPREEFPIPDGWKWRDVWSTDVQRAVDGEGWEYTVQKGITGWSPQQKLYHVLRRRRWIRERCRQKDYHSKEHDLVEGWEYALFFGLRFHARERRVDSVRRRRWRRKLVPVGSRTDSTPPRILISDKEGAETGVLMTCPRQYVVSSEVHQYQLRAYIYQARDLTAGDKTGLSDPYAVISFCGGTQQTERQMTTLCPTWDQTLIFDDVTITGPLLPVSNTSEPPPCVFVEVYDWDARGEPEFLGRVSCQPTIQDSSSGAYRTPQLKWYELSRGSQKQGELLAAFELLVKGTGDLPMPPPSRADLFMVPFGVRPLLQRTRIEILCWGVRNMSTYELQSVTRPSIEFECGGQPLQSTIMDNLRLNPNFSEPHLILDVELPKEEIFMPPLTLRVMDHRAFGSRPVVATALVSNLFQYTVEPKAARRKRKGKDSTMQPREGKLISRGQSIEAFKPSRADKPGTVDTDIDWWAKLYASTNDVTRCGSYLKKGYERLEVFTSSLENDKRFSGFTDLVDTIPLTRGRGDKSQTVGEFKGTFRIYPLVGDDDPPLLLTGFPSPAPQEVIARVYIVEGRDLAPKDTGGSSDPYVTVTLGKQSCSGKKEYKPNTLHPIFGRMFEVTATLPVHKDLKIQIWDHDMLGSDDLIGETMIDLENRFLSRHRATTGLGRQYHVSGPNLWRDHELPSVILDGAAKLRQMDGPTWVDDQTLSLSGQTHRLKEYEPEGTPLPPTLGEARERLALHVLHAALPLVPEHVETRDLHHPARPGLSQGKILLWVDLFPAEVTLPPPLDITPRKPHKYEVRVCVYNIFDAPLQETNFAGEQMSDIYVKGWLQGTNEVRKTDIHYRCLDGEANFNWRLVFPVEYLAAEQMMVVHRKTSLWTSDKAEERRPPQLTLQLWDNDLILRDDYLSEMTLDLCNLPKPAKSLNKVNLNQLNPAQENGGPRNTTDGTSTFLTLPTFDDPARPDYLNLWEVKRVYGFFPFTRVIDGNVQVAGKLEAEIEIVHADEATARPAGHGRDEPNMNPSLNEPKRPATSFLWLSSPWKSFRHVMWKNYKWYIITFIVLFFLLLFIFLLLYSLPGATIDYIIGVD